MTVCVMREEHFIIAGQKFLQGSEERGKDGLIRRDQREGEVESCGWKTYLAH